MKLDKPRAREYLKAFDFTGLFTQCLGWDYARGLLSVTVDGKDWSLAEVAEKRGVQALVCEVPAGCAFPDYATRRKIDSRATRQAREHVIVYADAGKTLQVWQWVRRTAGMPVVCRELHFSAGQTGEVLLQRLEPLVFSLEEEEWLTSVDVVERLAAGTRAERVTKRFYDRFKTEHASFLRYLKGIPDEQLQRWYASVMLNRLMFIYFVQKKGFLDGDTDYLRHKLEQSRKRGKDRFYRDFLCPLFFDGFATREEERSGATRGILGRVPYLNGGIFLPHQIEQLHGNEIRVADAAFENLFTFFDAYQWHLDERPLRADNEVNPDVLGYIFEKYINQKQMGAYYTKEDITEYIGRETIVPRLLDMACQGCRVAFEGAQSVWRLLRENPDRYIFEPVRRGVIDAEGNVVPESRLPDFVQKGMHDPRARMFEKRYNLGDAEFRTERAEDFPRGCPRHVIEAGKLTLPTETWREYVARRQRCLELRNKLASGEIRGVNDLVTLNLDIRQFAQDVVETSEGPELLRAFWHGLNSVSVLDPTCGSGAFLFAALNILFPLYQACLTRMQAFVSDLERSGEKHSPKKFQDFKEVLARVREHPNEHYFILKSIILNNLFGVDIMDEAVEICKLRLFLKLAAQVEPDPDKPNFGIEPLPDIDFNIRCGNTLVGYATEAQVRAAYDRQRKEEQTRFAYGEDQDALAQIAERAQEVERLTARFREQQTTHGGEVTAGDKEALQKRLRALEHELNLHLAREYGVKGLPSAPNSSLMTNNSSFSSWLSSHRPFHWFVEFYGIMKPGGFDVVIGNPPYVDYSPIELGYSCRGFATEVTGDLYAMTVERGFSVMREDGRQGMIVPLSLTFSRDFRELRKLLLGQEGLLVYSSFDNIPDRLFTGAKESDNTSKANQQRTTIFVWGPSPSGLSCWSSPLLRWRAAERDRLFQELPLCEVTSLCSESALPKLGCPRMRDFLARWMAAKRHLKDLIEYRGRFRLVIPRTAGYYVAAYPDEMDRTKQMVLRFRSADARGLAIVLLNSGVFFWVWRVVGDGFDVTTGQVEGCVVPALADRRSQALAQELLGALKECTVLKGYRGVDVPNVNFNKRLDLLWRIDEWVIKHIAPDLGVTPEDFLWAKSSSFLKLRIAKSGCFPPGYEFVGADD